MPRKLLKIETNPSIVEDNFLFIEKDFDGDISELSGEVMVPSGYWSKHSEALKSSELKVAVWLDSDETADTIKDFLNDVEFVAINFPKFADGRGYSIARLLRERFGYEGEIRAIGDVLLDQLHYMKRCGISSFEVREDKDIEKSVNMLRTFTESYQVAFDQMQPLFRRR